MPDYVILTDSAGDIPQQLADQMAVPILPLSFVIEGHVYQDFPDRRDMALSDFYALLRGGKTASTNGVNPEDYVQAIEPLLAGGQDVLVLAFSSGLSCTHQSAEIAAQTLRERYPQQKLFVVDTLCASMGQALLVWHAVNLQKEGKRIEEVRDWAEENKLRICHHITPDDLYFLKRGGRISAATAVMGSMLSIKPVIHVDNEGHLISVGKERGRSAALKALVDKMEQTAYEPGEQAVFISHGDCLDEAQLVADMIRQRFGTKEIYLSHMGPVIGAHAGPGTVALFFLGSPR